MSYWIFIIYFSTQIILSYYKCVPFVHFLIIFVFHFSYWFHIQCWLNMVRQTQKTIHITSFQVFSLVLCYINYRKSKISYVYLNIKFSRKEIAVSEAPTTTILRFISIFAILSKFRLVQYNANGFRFLSAGTHSSRLLVYFMHTLGWTGIIFSKPDTKPVSVC